MGSNSKHEDAFNKLLSSNKNWSAETHSTRPSLLPTLAKGQSPSILWFGCSDSRVPETTITGLSPGDIFVHRNIANVVSPSDISSLAVVEYAVSVVKVQHVVVCGHSGCGGVKGALGKAKLGGVLEGWLAGVRQARARLMLQGKFEGKSNEEVEGELIRENVKMAVNTLRENLHVQEAMKTRGFKVHGLVFDIESGLLDVVNCSGEEKEEVAREEVFG